MEADLGNVTSRNIVAALSRKKKPKARGCSRRACGVRCRSGILAVVRVAELVTISVAVAFPLELALMLSLVSAPLTAFTEVVAHDDRLVGPVAGLVDVSVLGANVSRRDPIGLRLHAELPATWNPAPAPAVPGPEAADPDVVRPRTR